MKKLISLLVLLFTIQLVNAQNSFNTGNVQLDTDLETINANAELDFGKFKTEISLKYDIKEKKIETMHAELIMNPGDIFMAVEIAEITKQPVDNIIEIYKVNKEKGWGVIAKEAGIKPGSAEFHALKNHAKENKSKGKKNKSKKKKKNK